MDGLIWSGGDLDLIKKWGIDKDDVEEAIRDHCWGVLAAYQMNRACRVSLKPFALSSPLTVSRSMYLTSPHPLRPVPALALHRDTQVSSAKQLTRRPTLNNLSATSRTRAFSTVSPRLVDRGRQGAASREGQWSGAAHTWL